MLKNILNSPEKTVLANLLIENENLDFYLIMTLAGFFNKISLFQVFPQNKAFAILLFITHFLSRHIQSSISGTNHLRL